MQDKQITVTPESVNPAPSVDPSYVAMQEMLGLHNTEIDYTRQYPPVIQPLINAMRSGGNIIDTLLTIVHRFGFTAFLFGVSAAPHPGRGVGGNDVNDITPVWALSNASMDWMKLYLSKGYLRVDPRVQGVLGSALPLYWDQTMYGRGELLNQFLNDAAKFGIRSGVSYLIPSPDGMGCIAAYNSDQPYMDEVTRGVILSHEATLMTLGNYVHQIFVRSMIQRGCPPLGRGEPITAHELEVIRLIASGLTQKEVAAKIDRSVVTVQSHANKAREKLGASTLAEALLVAERAGLLHGTATGLTAPPMR